MPMLDEHLDYVSDTVRMAAFRQAVTTVVKPGDTVVDLGCGTGILGTMCLEAGAARVYAIDSSEMLEVARETFARAGCGEIVHCQRAHSCHAVIPERVDLVICDQVGYFGFDAGIVPAFEDARIRFLKPGGRLLPRRLRLKIAAVDSAASHRPVAGWLSADVPECYRWLAESAANVKYAVELEPNEVVTEEITFGEIDLGGEMPEYFSWRATLSVRRDAWIHGLAGFFECELAEDVWMTNSPLGETRIERPQAFMPIVEPLSVKVGDVIEASVMTRPRDGALAWTLTCPDGRKLRQSTWTKDWISPEELTRGRPDHVPVLGDHGRARNTVLAYCDGRRNRAEIEAAVLREHPDLLPSAREIADFVARVLNQDTE